MHLLNGSGVGGVKIDAWSLPSMESRLERQRRLARLRVRRHRMNVLHREGRVALASHEASCVPLRSITVILRMPCMDITLCMCQCFTVFRVTPRPGFTICCSTIDAAILFGHCGVFKCRALCLSWLLCVRHIL